MDKAQGMTQLKTKNLRLGKLTISEKVLLTKYKISNTRRKNKKLIKYDFPS